MLRRPPSQPSSSDTTGMLSDLFRGNSRTNCYQCSNSTLSHISNYRMFPGPPSQSSSNSIVNKLSNPHSHHTFPFPTGADDDLDIFHAVGSCILCPQIRRKPSEMSVRPHDAHPCAGFERSKRTLREETNWGYACRQDNSHLVREYRLRKNFRVEPGSPSGLLPCGHTGLTT